MNKSLPLLPYQDKKVNLMKNRAGTGQRDKNSERRSETQSRKESPTHGERANYQLI